MSHIRKMKWLKILDGKMGKCHILLIRNALFSVMTASCLVFKIAISEQLHGLRTLFRPIFQKEKMKQRNCSSLSAGFSVFRQLRYFLLNKRHFMNSKILTIDLKHGHW